MTNGAQICIGSSILRIDQAAASRRLSLIFFHNPNYDADVAALPGTVPAGETPKYAPTTSGEHLRKQFLRTQV